MGRLLTCSGCKGKFEAEELTAVNTKVKLCPVCFSKKKQDEMDYKELISYICTSFNQKAPSGRQLADIKKFKNMGYEYKDIAWTIYYLYGVLKKKKEDGLGLIPFYYKQAMDHLSYVNNAKSSVEDYEELKEVTIVVNKPNKIETDRIKRTRLVDISSL